LSSLLQCEQCARCGNDLPQSKERQRVDFAHDSVPFLFCFLCFFCGVVCRKKKQMLFLDAPLRMAVRAVKGGGVSRSSERSGDP
jgi:hypothetical protein